MIPTSGWMPGVADTAGPTLPAHFVREGAEPVPGRYGREFVGACGARCYPLYGSDPTGRLARHPRCTECAPSCQRPGRGPRAIGLLLVAAALLVQSCGDQAAPAPSVAPLEPSTTVRRPPDLAIPAARCDVVDRETLTRLLREKITQDLNSHSDATATGLEQVDCAWQGSSNIPGQDVGIHTRSLVVTFDRFYPRARPSRTHPVEHAAQAFEVKYRGQGWERTEVDGANRATTYRSREYPDLADATVAAQSLNVLVSVNYYNSGSTRAEVEREARKLAVVLVARID